MDLSAAVFLSLGWLMLRFACGELDYISYRQGMRLQGNFTLAGFFPLHYPDGQSNGLPALVPCNEGTANKHGYYLLQAMRFAVEEINNSTGPQPLLPGVTLGYQMYDICSTEASILGTLDLLKQQYQSPSETEADINYNNSQHAVALIGPDSSSNSFGPAALLGAHLIPQISYEASNEMLGNKFRYPSFLRTIPSDKNQVAAMIQILVHFNWTWVAILGSDNNYGLEGMKSLSEQASQYGICIAYQGVIPAYYKDTVQTMRTVVDKLLNTKVNTIVVFSSKSKLKEFFPFVLERNVTGKVWIGTEDWSASSLISGIPRIHTIGTVLGVSIKYTAMPSFEEFTIKEMKAAMQLSDTQEVFNNTNDCLQGTDLYSLARKKFYLEKYDITSSFNVYKAVYAVAHALHKALGCDSGECQKRNVDPWELLWLIKDVQFSVDNTSVHFDSNGDPPTGYDIVFWVWRGTEWSLKEVPLSICSPPCLFGHKRLQIGQHVCCFDCKACPSATFLNASEPTTCQPCLPEEWAPPKSQQCLERTVLLLPWDDPLSIALLVFLATCLLMTSSSAVILLLNLNTPVAKSAGGRTCLLMLAALTASAMSTLCHFGQPSPLACILKQPLFIFSFTVCLACITVRSVQVVCIFKFASKLPPAYDKWAKNHGPEFTIFVVSVTILLISVLRVALNPPKPSKDLNFYEDSIVLECSNTLSPGAASELAYVSLLSVLCFSFSYMGKDLPANYNEAKSVTFSLMVYMMSWMSFFTLYLVSRGPFTIAAHVFAILFSVLAFLMGYFFPKIYIIALKPQMNTPAHFQNCIQMYTMNKQ
ncbi:taste receptor type 1 member 1 isoform X2 [Eleginops maclovinus]|uniref:taste receptor type 1 member 1 isoform X2 n=1 Tax=Eleginops maclovinus TaxID=56733 RepID=UPI003080F6FE